MKLTINVDCTPEEARRFLGLPDLGPVHAIYVDRLKTAVAEGVTPEVISGLIRTWGPFSENSLKMWTTMFEQARK